VLGSIGWMQTPIPVTGIWLRREGDDAVVLAEVDGRWRRLIGEALDGQFSHIIEPSGITKAPTDDAA
jgi:hypothetical protein